MPSKMKVLVAEDSALMRRILVDILEGEDFIDTVDIARNGKDCIEKAISLKPDIITLDIEMPIMDGISALKELIKIKPLPIIIMLSSFTTEGAETTIEALELGAADFITKPKGLFVQENINNLKRDLVGKIRNLIKSDYIYKPVAVPMPSDNIKIPRKTYLDKGDIKYIIGIGTSTGGPRALQEVITKMPENLPAAVFVVQHMPPVFTKSLADRLNALSMVTVKEAENRERVKANCVYIAPGDYHMAVVDSGKGYYEILLNQSSLVNGHRPSVDVMLDSLSKLKGEDIIAVIMTGMGSDGARGVKKVKNTGGITIAQNEETCVVYGMPKAAIATNAIDAIVPLKDITKTVLRYMGV